MGDITLTPAQHPVDHLACTLKAMTSAASSTARPQFSLVEPTLRHVPVGPLSFFDGDLKMAADWCVEQAANGRGARVATANLDFIALARKNSRLREDLANCHLVVADGAPVVWLSRAAGTRKTRRTTGVDLVAAIAERAVGAGGIRLAMYGSSPEISQQAAANLVSAYPALEVAGRICPPFGTVRSNEDIQAEVEQLANARPQVVLVALGCPRQERFIAEHFDAIPQAVWIGIGGTFDFYAGKRVRAPRIFQATGLEWAIRLVQEPRRLWRRYLLQDIPALLAVAPGCLLRRPLQASGEGRV